MNWIDRPIERHRGHFKYHSEKERRAARRRQRTASYERAKKEQKANPLATRGELGIRQPEKIIVPPDRLADAERIKYLSHPTLVGHLMGDPLPGRSALDKRG